MPLLLPHAGFNKLQYYSYSLAFFLSRNRSKFVPILLLLTRTDAITATAAAASAAKRSTAVSSAPTELLASWCLSWNFWFVRFQLLKLLMALAKAGIFRQNTTCSWCRRAILNLFLFVERALLRIFQRFLPWRFSSLVFFFFAIFLHEQLFGRLQQFTRR